MTLKDITVKKFIGLYDIMTAEFYATEVHRDIALLMCVTGKEESYYDALTVKELLKQKEEISFLSLENVEGKATRYIKANGKTYAPVYDFTKLTGGQLVDVLHFVKDKENIIINLPKILASVLRTY